MQIESISRQVSAKVQGSAAGQSSPDAGLRFSEVLAAGTMTGQSDLNDSDVPKPAAQGPQIDEIVLSEASVLQLQNVVDADVVTDRPMSPRGIAHHAFSGLTVQMNDVGAVVDNVQPQNKVDQTGALPPELLGAPLGALGRPQTHGRADGARPSLPSFGATLPLPVQEGDRATLRTVPSDGSGAVRGGIDDARHSLFAVSQLQDSAKVVFPSDAVPPPRPEAVSGQSNSSDLAEYERSIPRSTAAERMDKQMVPLARESISPPDQASMTARAPDLLPAGVAFDRADIALVTPDVADTSLGATDDRSTRGLEVTVPTARSAFFQSGARLDPAMLAVLRDAALAASTENGRLIELDTGSDVLGKLSLAIQSQDGTLQVTLLSGRPETLDLLRRALGIFLRDLSAQGFHDVDVHLGPREASDFEPRQRVFNPQTGPRDADAQTPPATPRGYFDKRL